jgi:hypothetical protein
MTAYLLVCSTIKAELGVVVSLNGWQRSICLVRCSVWCWQSLVLMSYRYKAGNVPSCRCISDLSRQNRISIRSSLRTLFVPETVLHRVVAPNLRLFARPSTLLARRPAPRTHGRVEAGRGRCAPSSVSWRIAALRHGVEWWRLWGEGEETGRGRVGWGRRGPRVGVLCLASERPGLNDGVFTLRRWWLDKALSRLDWENLTRIGFFEQD